jgi:hypothetical protein
MQFSTDGGASWSAWQAYSTSATVTLPAADGVYSVQTRVMDVAGNTSTSSQTIRLDRSGPAITTSQTAPTNSGSYDVGATLVLGFGATDLDNVSSISATLDGSTSVSSGGSINLYTLTAGTHTIVITATDGLGNTSRSTSTFQLHPTIGGLTNAVNYGANVGLIAKSLQTTLLSTLQSAQAALTAGNHTLAKSYLNSFLSQMQSAGSKITASYATLLVNWTQDLIARL